MMKKIPLMWKILTGLVLGILWGLIALSIGLEKFTYDWIKPWGTIFINLLKLIAVPLVFVSLVVGISTISEISRLTRIGLRTIALFLTTSLIAVLIGLFLVHIINPGSAFSEEKQTELKQKYYQDTNPKEKPAGTQQEKSPLQLLVDMVPDNIIQAASDNTRMLQVIFFAIIFAVSLVLLPHGKVSVVKYFFAGLNEVIMKLIDIIMVTAPFGVFALISSLVVDFSGDVDLFAALGLYSITYITGMFLLILLFYPLVTGLFAGTGILGFMRAILPAQMVAFTTSSSAATLPVTKEQVENELGVSQKISGFVLPIGVTINMDGTSCYLAIAVVFVAQVFGIPLDLVDQLTILLMALLVSIGAPGIPSGSIIMLTAIMASVDLPAAGLALIIGVDRPLDMLRTVVNITGDSTVAVLVAKAEGELKPQSTNAFVSTRKKD
ncbi:MAG: dicarboxylate/amino acid:cation symporter [Bacteroidales bacterium]|nr:MAG: dicarboxylate/amino acid:cation symporter [Bacteroidales bacterium]